MKITIDTKEDSPEHLRQIIKFLAALTGDQQVLSTAPSQTPEAVNTQELFTGLFDEKAADPSQMVERPKPVFDGDFKIETY